MMLPALTTSPPYFFTPRRCEFESRPFLVDPCPFLCAISLHADDVGYSNVGLRLAMSPALAFVLLGLIVERVDLGAFALPDDLDANLCALDERRSNGHLVAVADHQNLIELYLGASFTLELLDD